MKYWQRLRKYTTNSPTMDECRSCGLRAIKNHDEEEEYQTLRERFDASGGDIPDWLMDGALGKYARRYLAEKEETT